MIISSGTMIFSKQLRIHIGKRSLSEGSIVHALVQSARSFGFDDLSAVNNCGNFKEELTRE